MKNTIKETTIEKNLSESSIRLNTGRVFYAIRKFHGYGQSELAKEFNLSQSNISKIENGILAPDLFFWMEFTRAFKVQDPNCFYYGSAEIEDIPRLGKVEMSFYKRSGLKIPKHYFSIPLMTSRKIRPLIEVFEKTLTKEWNKFLSDSKIPGAIFDILNFPIPTLLVKDVADFFQKHAVKLDFAADLNLMTQANHGLIFDDYAHASTPVHMLKYFIQKQREYGIGLEYSIAEEKGNELTVHVHVSPQLINFLSKQNQDMTTNKLFNFSAQYPLYLMRTRVPQVNPKVVILPQK
ncbi:MAG: helix-turn-helix transcriptional regulator [Bdellovibrio sp.]|nr:helix-turn-helix transcriptional regulator [Bdellovibrio sp.]